MPRHRQRPAYLLFSPVVDIAEHVSCGLSLCHATRRVNEAATLRVVATIACVDRTRYVATSFLFRFAEPHLGD